MNLCGCCPANLVRCYLDDRPCTCNIPTVVAESISSTIPQPVLVANPNGVGAISLAATCDNNIAGASYGGFNTDGNNNAAINIVLEYRWATPQNRVINIRLYNSGGGILNDGDGIDTATATLLDGAGVVLWQGPLNANNGTNVDITPVPFLNGVRVLRLTNIVGLPGAAPDILWRNINLHIRYQALITWTCCDKTVTGFVEGINNGITFTAVTGNLVQVNGPHTITFNSTTPFNAVITTNQPASFSTLNITNGTVVTVSGNRNQTFRIDGQFEDTFPAFAMVCDDTVEYQSVTGAVIPTNQLFEC